jgi:hypothetical protein
LAKKETEMSERNKEPLQAPTEGAQQAAPSNNRAGFDRAENRMAAGNQDSDARAREAVAGIENRPSADRASKRDVADAMTRHATDAEKAEGSEADRAASKKLDDALDEKARERGVNAAEESSQTEWGLTPHNI